MSKSRPIIIWFKDDGKLKVGNCYSAKISECNDLPLSKYTPDNFQDAKEMIIDSLEDSDFLEIAIRKLLLKEKWEISVEPDGSKSVLIENLVEIANVGYMKDMIEKDGE